MKKIVIQKIQLRNVLNEDVGTRFAGSSREHEYVMSGSNGAKAVEMWDALQDSIW